jgi:hypothetical protein
MHSAENLKSTITQRSRFCVRPPLHVSLECSVEAAPVSELSAAPYGDT